MLIAYQIADFTAFSMEDLLVGFRLSKADCVETPPSHCTSTPPPGTTKNRSLKVLDVSLGLMRSGRISPAIVTTPFTGRTVWPL